MDRKKVLLNQQEEKIFNDIHSLHEKLCIEFKNQFSRSLPFTEELFDRWERAKKLNWGEGTSVYDNAFIFGNVEVGKNCWIGPYTIIDGSGGLFIGNNCTISAGVHIYTHDNLMQTLSGGKDKIEYSKVIIGDCTYIGPQSIISKNVIVGNHCVVAANSFVNKNVDDFSIVAGNPAKKIGSVVITDNNIAFEYS